MFGFVIRPDGVTTEVASTYDATAWATEEANGAVFLPAAGVRTGTAMNNNSIGHYWSSTVNTDHPEKAHFVYLQSGNHNLNDSWERQRGLSVRLVRVITP